MNIPLSAEYLLYNTVRKFFYISKSNIF